MPNINDPLIPNAGALTGDESIPVGNGTNAALVTTPANLKTYINADRAEAVAAAIANVVGTTPETLNTLQELAGALGEDPNFAATTAASIGGKINKSLATAANLFLVSSGIGEFVVKTVEDVKALLGLGSAAYKDVGTAAGTVMAGDDSRATESLTSLMALNGGTSTLDLSLGRSFLIDISLLLAGTHTIAFSNVPAGARNVTVTLFIKTGATIPTLTMPLGAYALTASKTNRVLMDTLDAGVTWSYADGGVR